VTDWWGLPVDCRAAVLASARSRFPIGDEDEAVVLASPWPAGTVGLPLTVRGLDGFVDVGHLPTDPAEWPQVGDVLRVVAAHHRGTQVRVVPVEPRFARPVPADEQRRWAGIRSRYASGDVVDGVVTDVFTANLEAGLDLGDIVVTFPWTPDAEPVVGEVRRVCVVRGVDALRTIVVEPAPRRR
jgi:hypothetical protein